MRKAFLLRVDPSLLDALQSWAQDEFRSLNGQMEFLLRRALIDSGRLPTRRRPAKSPEPGRSASSSDDS